MFVVLAALSACAPLPSLDHRTITRAFENTADTHIGRTVAPLARAHPGQSGIVALVQGMDAFAARIRLADAAERSLDIQYYIWRNDMAGNLLFDALRRAADRGVRVRLLLDDGNTQAMDAVLAGLDAHRNIEVRLFNPFSARVWRAWEYLSDFRRLNRRMHNKSFTVDGQVTIIGGRNVGDEYFGADHNLQFVDLDVMAIGDVVHRVSQDFDRYWASDSAYPAARVLRAHASPQPLTDTQDNDADGAARKAAYLDAVARQPFTHDMLEGRLKFEWADVQVVSDDPSKALGNAADEDLLWARLKRIIGAPKQELDLVSAYFVPGRDGSAHFAAMARSGVKVTVVTNSLEATDVPAVFAGYASRREQLVRAGVTLYELKRAAVAADGGRFRLAGSSASSLHAKTFAIDRSTAFVGSFNFDPRSSRLNTELGFVIESPAIAERISEAVHGPLARLAYLVRLSPQGHLQWVDRTAAAEVVYDTEPGAGFWRQLGVSLLSWLPIEWLL